jgi:iron(III) transport system ATP-binding protein
MTVIENVAYGLTVKGLAKREAHARAEEGLSLVGLEGYGARLPSELSGGQQQRVAVARAIVLEPEVLLLDEPLSNLDAKLRRHVREEIRQIQQRLDLTAIYVTHDQEEAMAVSDRIIVMNKAVIAQEGSPHDLYERPNSAFIADFIGDANLIDCSVGAAKQGATTLELATGRLSIPETVDWTGTGKLVLRPQHIKLTNGEGRRNGFAGRITYAAYLGNQIEYSVDGDLGSLYVIAKPTANPHAVGDVVTIGFDKQDVRLVRD